MPEGTATTYAIVIVNYGDPSLIAENIGTDIDRDGDALVVVVDNFSTERARLRTRALCRDRGWLFASSSNDGFGAGVNRGVATARSRGAEVFITLNPDAVASADVLRGLARHVIEEPCALVSPFMDTSNGRPHFRGTMINCRTGQMRRGWSENDDDPVWKNWLSGACLAFSGEAFDLLQGFSEDYFLYWEDVDISRRAVERGLRLALRPDLLVTHDEGGTQGTGNSRTKSPTYYYYNIRNRMLFGRQQLQGWNWARWVLASPRQSALIWMRGGRRQALTHPRGLAAAVRGLFAGAVQLTHRPGQRRTAPRRTPAEGRS